MKKLILVTIILTLALSAIGCEKKNWQEDVEGEGNILSEEAFKSKLNNEEVVLLDARSSAAYNGWALKGEEHNGHIEGANLFSSFWIDSFESSEKVEEYLKNKLKVTKDSKIVIYGYDTQAKELANKLDGLGYSTSYLEKSYDKITLGDKIKLASMKNYETLVHPKWVKSVLDGNSDIDDYIIGEVSWGEETKLETFIPESIHIHTGIYEEGPLWNRVSDEKILEGMLSHGITKDKVVILYGVKDSTAAYRVANILMYAGVEDVRVLDGGLSEWNRYGYETIKKPITAKAEKSTGLESVVNKDYIIDMDEAEGLLKSPKGDLVSIRSWDEYIGETSGYDYIEAAGRIKGAKYGYGGSDPWHMEDYRNPDNTMIDYERLVKRFNTMGITSENSNSFYCGTGWRAAEVWFYANAIGWDNISVYDGGWKEWSEAGKPSAKGVPESGVPEGK